MSINDGLDSDGPEDFVSELLEGGYLAGAEIGAAKAFLEGGMEGMTPAQQRVLQAFVLEKHSPGGCNKCRQGIPWSEQYEAKHNGGFCSYCAHQISKADQDD